MKFIALTADEPFLCSACGWDVEKGETYISVSHDQQIDDQGFDHSHRDNICLVCEEKRQGKVVESIAIDGYDAVNDAAAEAMLDKEVPVAAAVNSE